MKSNKSSGRAGYLVSIINYLRTKRVLKNLQDENDSKQGIVHYQPSPISVFFNDSEPFGNMVFSGGLNSIRALAIARSIECAQAQSYKVVVIHNSNQELELTLEGYLGKPRVSIINSSNPLYEPFLGLQNPSIWKLVFSSADANTEIKPIGKYYIDGISDFIRAKGIHPYCRMYISCPHLTLIDKVNDAEARGQIPSGTARTIITEIIQGESERGNIENYFLTLGAQADGVLARKKDLSVATSVRLATHRNKVLCMDVQSGTNTLLINLILNEIKEVAAHGQKVLVVADNIQLVSNDSIKSLIGKSGTNYSFILSSDDVFSSFNGDEQAFFSYTGKCSRILLSKHSSAYSCQKWSDTIGYYDKKEVNETYAQNTNFVDHWGIGASHASNITTKRESIIKPEELRALETDEFYILNKSSGKLSFARII